MSGNRRNSRGNRDLFANSSRPTLHRTCGWENAIEKFYDAATLPAGGNCREKFAFFFLVRVIVFGDSVKIVRVELRDRI